MDAYLLDWLNLLVRWLHLIAGIAWIGASFYFVMLDNSLSPPTKAADRERGVFGELWAVHGGGYQSQKFRRSKGELTENPTGRSGRHIRRGSGKGCSLIYWIGAGTYLSMSQLDTAATGIVISIAVVVGGYSSTTASAVFCAAV
jgi:uncharacterized membrane protein